MFERGRNEKPTSSQNVDGGGGEEGGQQRLKHSKKTLRRGRGYRVDRVTEKIRMYQRTQW